MSSTAMPSGLVLTRDEVAKILRVSVATVDREIAEGRLPALRIGPGRRLVRVRRDDLATWLHRSEDA
jgi:excisionase family DNA binding protein